MKKFLAPLLALMMVLGLSASAGAITKGGSLDGDDHPYVGLMVATEDGEPIWRCSGALISATVYITAGHCTESPANGALLWFESDLEPDPSVFGYPFESGITGSTFTHPLYDPNAFFFYDLGVVILDEPVFLDEYASLPTPGYVEEYLGGKGRKRSVVTAVGYGLQRSSPPSNGRDLTQADKTRYQADLKIVNTNGVAGIGKLPDSNSMVLSGDARAGGTCFGDSGGPILDGDVIIAVVSFGLNPTCGGIGGVFRIDRDIELGWINSFG